MRSKTNRQLRGLFKFLKPDFDNLCCFNAMINGR